MQIILMLFRCALYFIFAHKTSIDFTYLRRRDIKIMVNIIPLVLFIGNDKNP